MLCCCMLVLLVIYDFINVFAIHCTSSSVCSLSQNGGQYALILNVRNIGLTITI